MMPIDLDNPRLRKSLRGYHTEDVDELLAVAARSMEQVIAENAALREQCERQRVELDRLRDEESLVKQALVSAQRIADDIRLNAQHHADLILEEARQSALAEKVAGQQQLSEMRWEIEKLRQTRQRFVEEFQCLLAKHQRDLTVVPGWAVVESPSSAVAS